MTLTILEILYIVFIIFGSVIGTLLILILVRVLKILGPVMELVEFYNKIKQIFNVYASIPDKIKEHAKDIIKK